MKITLTKNKVRIALLKYPHLRDDDNKLLATIWANEFGGKDKCKEFTAFSFLEMLSKGLLSNSESIRRMRQKLQETEPDLRGENYEIRKKLETNVKNDLKNGN